MCICTTECGILGTYNQQGGVEADLGNIKDMVEWLLPKTITLRGFLGLIGYYKKFMKGYGVISKPLCKLFQKGNFQWTEEAKTTFEVLKIAMSTTAVLLYLTGTKFLR